jgi:pentatricopeptide repeat protein
LKNGQGGSASEVLEGMERNGVQPTIELLNALLAHHAFGKSPDFPAIISLLNKVAESPGLEPDVFTFTIILQALLKSNRKEATKKLIGIMEVTGVRPSLTTYSMIISSLCRGQGALNGAGATEKDLIAAVELLDEMERSKIGSNEIVYTSIIQGFLNAMSTINISASDPGLPATMKESSVVGLHPYFVAAMTIKTRMEGRGFSLNRIGANALIRAALALQTRAGVELAIQLFDNLRIAKSASTRLALDIELDAEDLAGTRGGTSADTWYVMINGFVQMGDWSRARKLVEELIREGFVVKSKPLKQLVNLVLRGGRLDY